MTSATLPLADIDPGTAKRIVVGGTAVCLVRIDDDVFAIGDVCSHGEVSLAGGEVWTDECEVECPQHGSVFSLTTGEPNTLPATQPVPVFAATVTDGVVTVTVGGPA